jgi:hypothetical protein
MISSKFEAKTGIGSCKNPAEQGLFASARYRRSMFVITIDSNRVREATVEGPTTRFSDLDVGAQLAPSTAAQGQSLHSAPPDGAGRGSDDPVDTGSNLFQAQLFPPDCELLKFRNRLSEMVQADSAYKALKPRDRGRYRQFVQLFNEGGEIKGWRQSYLQILWGLSERQVRRVIERFEQAGLIDKARTWSYVGFGIARRKRWRANVYRIPRRFMTALKAAGKLIRRWAEKNVRSVLPLRCRWEEEAPEGFYYVPGLHVYAPIDAWPPAPDPDCPWLPDRSPAPTSRRPLGRLLWLRLPGRKS